MAYQKKTDAPRKKAPSAPRLSNIVRPRGMSLEGWQTALRRQAARKENFGIVEVDMDHSSGEYLVISPATQGRYQVHYHGEGHELNACSCMDYRTSRLGTCKHLEAIKIWISDISVH